MHRSRNVLTLAITLSASLALIATGCSKNTADLELQAANDAIENARAHKASDCASETFTAAETAIAEARRLAEDGEVDDAKAKALEAEALAQQASAASPEGCDQPKKEELKDSDQLGQETMTQDASSNMRLEDVLETVYFDYNDASIREDSKELLSRVAEALSTKSDALEIEGHCDVRGSTEYNLHLGERRARSVMKYLTTQGVEPTRLRVISYGEERPIDLGTDEAAHQKNRRAELKRL